MGYVIRDVGKQKEIFQTLTTNNDFYSLPVRGMMEFIIAGKIPSGQIFVDDLNQYSSVAAIHEMSEYSKLELDVMTIYSRNSTVFESFFEALTKIRQWHSRGLMVIFMPVEFVEKSKRILNTLKCDDLGAMYFMYRPRDTCLKLMNDVANVKLVSDHFTMEPCKPTDAETIISTFKHGVPDAVKMFQWMIKQFPSSSIRTTDGRPIAWILTYSSGSGGPLYVDPEYRRHGFADVLNEDVARRHHCAGYINPRHGGVAPTNNPSMTLYSKPEIKFVNTNKLCTWLVFSQKAKARL